MYCIDILQKLPSLYVCTPSLIRRLSPQFSYQLQQLSRVFLTSFYFTVSANSFSRCNLFFNKNASTLFLQLPQKQKQKNQSKISASYIFSVMAYIYSTRNTSIDFKNSRSPTHFPSMHIHAILHTCFKRATQRFRASRFGLKALYF